MQKPAFRPQIFSTDQYQITLPEGHKFPVSKHGILRDLIEKERLFQLEQAAPAKAEIVSLAHDPAYVAGFMEGSLPAQAMRRIGLRRFTRTGANETAGFVTVGKRRRIWLPGLDSN